MYTDIKKAALKRAVTSQLAVVEVSLQKLRGISEYLSANLTTQELPLKADLNGVIQNLRYEQELLQSFKDNVLSK